MLYNFLELKHLMTIAYHPQTWRSAEKYDRTIIARLLDYVADHQRDRDIFVQHITCIYINQVKRSTGKTHLSFVPSKHPPSPIIFDPPLVLPTEAKFTTAPSGFRSRLLHRISMMRKKAVKKLIIAQHMYEIHHGLHVHTVTSFRSEQWVYIDCPSLAETGTDRLGTDLYTKLFLQISGPHCIPSATADPVTIK